MTSNTLWGRRSCTVQGLAALLVAVVALGCGSNSDAPPVAAPVTRFIPSPETAQAALEAVLADWREGKPRESIDRLAVKVVPIDNQRKKGQELDDFEILGEVPYEGARCFAVRLSMTHPVAEQKVRYVILGIDPLFVWRQEDLDLFNHWDHMMPEEEVPQTEAAAPGGQEPTTAESLSKAPADQDAP